MAAKEIIARRVVVDMQLAVRGESKIVPGSPRRPPPAGA